MKRDSHVSLHELAQDIDEPSSPIKVGAMFRKKK